MYDVTILIHRFGQHVKSVRRTVDALTLRALQTIHGHSNVLINL
jgi:hypothetical protein